MTTVLRFGENKQEEWYETKEGRIKCDEDTIEKLWWKWIMTESESRRNTINGFTVYEFKKPLKINLNNNNMTTEKKSTWLQYAWDNKDIQFFLIAFTLLTIEIIFFDAVSWWVLEAWKEGIATGIFVAFIIIIIPIGMVTACGWAMIKAYRDGK